MLAKLGDQLQSCSKITNAVERFSQIPPPRVNARNASSCPSIKKVFETLRKDLSAPPTSSSGPHDPVVGAKMGVMAHHVISRAVSPLADVEPHSGLNQFDSTSGGDKLGCGSNQSNPDVGPHSGVCIAILQKTTAIGVDGSVGVDLQNVSDSADG